MKQSKDLIIFRNIVIDINEIACMYGDENVAQITLKGNSVPININFESVEQSNAFLCSLATILNANEIKI